MQWTSVNAFVMDWNNLSWTQGALTKTYFDIDGEGTDVTVTITGDTGRFISGYPKIANDFTGGYSAAVADNLDIFVNYAANTESITISVTFSQAVENVSFELFDLDRGVKNKGSHAFIDQVANVKGSLDGGTEFGANAAYNASYVGQSGSGVATEYYGTTESLPDTSGNGNLNLSFGAQLDTFSFVYGNRNSGGDKTKDNPDQQGIGFYDIAFTKVGPVIPETSTVLYLAGIGLVICWHQRRGLIQFIPVLWSKFRSIKSRHPHFHGEIDIPPVKSRSK